MANSRDFNDAREGGDNTFETVCLRPSIFEDLLGLRDTSASVVVTHDIKRPLQNSKSLEFWIESYAEDYAGGHTIELILYRESKIDPTSDFMPVQTFEITTPAVNNGSFGKVKVFDFDAIIPQCTYYSCSCTLLQAGATGALALSLVRTGEDISISENGFITAIDEGNVALGASTVLKANTPCKAVSFTSNYANANGAYITTDGSAASASNHGHSFPDGYSTKMIYVDNTNKIFTFGTAGDKLAYIIYR